MPIYFELIDINTNDAADLIQIDDRICELFQIETHPRYYGGGLYDWYNTIGHKLAEGYTLEDGDKSVTNFFFEDVNLILFTIIVHPGESVSATNSMD